MDLDARQVEHHLMQLNKFSGKHRVLPSINRVEMSPKYTLPLASILEEDSCVSISESPASIEKSLPPIQTRQSPNSRRSFTFKKTSISPQLIPQRPGSWFHQSRFPQTIAKTSDHRRVHSQLLFSRRSPFDQRLKQY